MKILINISIITFDSITFLSKNTNFCFISTGLSFQEHYLRQALEILPLYEIHFTEKNEIRYPPNLPNQTYLQ